MPFECDHKRSRPYEVFSCFQPWFVLARPCKTATSRTVPRLQQDHTSTAALTRTLTTGDVVMTGVGVRTVRVWLAAYDCSLFYLEPVLLYTAMLSGSKPQLSGSNM